MTVQQMPIWVMCESCGDFWCTHHQEHVFECSCCGVECWLNEGVDPYLAIPNGFDLSGVTGIELCKECGFV